MDTLVQSVSTYSGIGIFDLSGTVGPAGSSDTFAMYLFTNGAEKIFGGPEALDAALGLYQSSVESILGLNITDISNTPDVPEAKDDVADITDNVGEPEKADAEKFYSDIEKALPFSVAEEKKNEAAFADMYVTSAAKRFGFSETEKETLTRDDYTARCRDNLNILEGDSFSLRVPVGAGELPLLMDRILRVISEGGTLEDALWEQIDRYGQGSLNGNTDLFWIDPESGEVLGAFKYERTVEDNEWRTLFEDDSAVLTAADDLASFIRYAVFALADDDPERVKDFLEHLKNKQAYADYARFILDLKPNADINGVMELIKANLTAAGIMGGNGSGGDSHKNYDTLTPENELKEILESIGSEEISDGTI